MITYRREVEEGKTYLVVDLPNNSTMKLDAALAELFGSEQELVDAEYEAACKAMK